jgi:type II secretion system protein G
MEARGHAYGSSKGFTLIELLVVVAIIGLLASIILVSLNGARSKGSDARRIADIREIQNALELYLQTCRSYPNVLSLTANNGSCPGGVTLGTFLSSIPKDPRSNDGYLYTAFGSGAPCYSYHLGADLEVGQDEGADVSANGASKCTGGAYSGGLGNGISVVPAINSDFAPGGSVGAWVYDAVP